MPLYEYRCQRCDRTFEVFTQRKDLASPPACPDCGKNAQVERVWSPFAGRVGGGCASPSGGGG
jgi:putative FmdB family regulatory protein